MFTNDHFRNIPSRRTEDNLPDAASIKSLKDDIAELKDTVRNLASKVDVKPITPLTGTPWSGLDRICSNPIRNTPKRVREDCQDEEQPLVRRGTKAASGTVKTVSPPEELFWLYLSAFDPSTSDIDISTLNIGGINRNVDDIRLAVSDQCYDIVVLTETWLDSRTLSHQMFGKDYEVFRCDRNADNSRKARGGGVLVAVNSRLEARAVDNQKWICLEQVWTAITLGDRTLFLCALYIPPDRIRERELFETHCQSVFSVLETAKATDEVILMGDFNLPRISWKKSCNGFLYPDLAHSTIPPNASFLLDNYSFATLSQINYVTNQNDRSLDLCFVSAQDTAPFLCRAPAPLVKHTPHHPPLLVTVGTKLSQDFDISPVAISYDFRNADHCGISQLLSSFNWDDILDTVNVESAALTFSNVLAYVIDRYVPKKKCHHASRKPWQTCVLRRLKSMKRVALRNFTTHRTQILQYQYARINHEYKRVAKQSFLHYQRRVQRKLKSHPKQFWKFANEQRHSAGLPSSMAFNGIVASTQRDICNLFSDKFASVFTDESLSDEHIRHAAGYVPLSNQTLSRVDISLEMISRSFSKLKEVERMNSRPHPLHSLLGPAAPPGGLRTFISHYLMAVVCLISSDEVWTRLRE
ncbi:uncharacterized protein LOC129765598 [Toxorhynchites rutilus septentrionalis]|uniref:uncharacterized protein LOC129765598 n=1 Tax=Toxorhynchites rutilus septentrionalis TaxID=329112 RepID=UPI002478425E|nr:uncharacterized protein LOC129765598 [Toxorhynchites rutilus septentrionalis]